MPIQQSIFETLVVYNMTQFLFNAFVSGELLREAWALHGWPKILGLAEMVAFEHWEGNSEEDYHGSEHSLLSMY